MHASKLAFYSRCEAAETSPTITTRRLSDDIATVDDQSICFKGYGEEETLN